MKRVQNIFLCAILIALGLAGDTAAVQVGDAEESVVNELGSPPMRFSRKGHVILWYDDIEVKVKEGLVVQVFPKKPIAPLVEGVEAEQVTPEECVQDDESVLIELFEQSQNELNQKVEDAVDWATVSPEKVEWFKWCALKAASGDAEAQLALGGAYYIGEYIAQDYKRAVQWLELAADQGLPFAQYLMGLCYFNSCGVPADKAQAVRFFQTAAMNGDASSQLILASCYSEGVGIARSNKEAWKWYRKAAEGGSAEAQYVVGATYLNAEIGQYDVVDAIAWLKLAEYQGVTKASRLISRTQVGMSPEWKANCERRFEDHKALYLK